MESSDSNKSALFFLEPLSKNHNRDEFKCGIRELDRYLQTQASQDARNSVATPFVLIEKKSGRIAGYFTLSALSLDLEELPKNISSKLPKYAEIPATLLGRLAVDERFQGQGMGGWLLRAALGRVVAANQTVASWAVVVDAKDEKAKSFYERVGFESLLHRPYRLFIPVKIIIKLLESKK